MPPPDRDHLADALAAMSGEPDSDAECAPLAEVKASTEDVPEQRVTAPSLSADRSALPHGVEGAPAARTDGAGRRRPPGTDDLIEFKRTMIPILLTCGALLLTAAGLALAEVLTGWATWAPIAMIATGLVLLGLAALNMLHVRDRIRT